MSWLLVLMLAVLPQFASAGPFPWPWPWAYCPIEWQDLQGHYKVMKNQKGESISFQLSRASENSKIGIHVRRVDANGVLSDGYAVVAAKRLLVPVKMVPYQSGSSPYWLEIGMALDLDAGARSNSRTCREPMKPQIMVVPPEQEAEFYFVLDPALRH
jgi:hypothetical protein